MKKKTIIQKVKKTLILLDAEAKKAPIEEKNYYNGMKMGVHLVKSKLLRCRKQDEKVTIFDIVTRSPEDLARYVYSYKCFDHVEAEKCIGNRDCVECITEFLMSEAEITEKH